VAWVHLGQPATIRAAAASVLPRLRSYLWLMTMVGFVPGLRSPPLYTMFAILFAYLPAAGSPIRRDAKRAGSKSFGNLQHGIES